MPTVTLGAITLYDSASDGRSFTPPPPVSLDRETVIVKLPKGDGELIKNLGQKGKDFSMSMTFAVTSLSNLVTRFQNANSASPVTLSWTDAIGSGSITNVVMRSAEPETPRDVIDGGSRKYFVTYNLTFRKLR